MDVVIVCSIPGQGIRRSLENLCENSSKLVTVLGHRDQADGVRAIEDFAVAAAADPIHILNPRDTASLSNLLKLPLPHLVSACRTAIQQAFSEVKKLEGSRGGNEIGVLAMHPVLYHSTFREFIAPYDASAFIDGAKASGVRVKMVLSIHDDIYDIYCELLKDWQLFSPVLRVNKQGNRHRNAIEDIQDLLLLMNWRSTELTTSKLLAASIRARHFLFHQKGHLESLVKILEGREPSVYLSHPISQPRRDISMVSAPDKSEVPDKARGIELQDSINEAALKLRPLVALVEPTAIDEYRIDHQKLQTLTENDLPDDAIIPPLLRRWPLVDGRHVSGKLPSNLDGTPYVTTTLGPFRDATRSTESLGQMASAAKVLETEIRRQVNVRDHSLAEQCDLVLAYRPFSKPDSTAPTGGVLKEIEVVYRKFRLNTVTCKPALIILHPDDDELRRRDLAFNKAWDDLSTRYILKAQHQEREAKLELQALARAYKRSDDLDSLVELAVEKLTKSKLKFHAAEDTSSMDPTKLQLVSVSINSFADALFRNSNILVSQLEETVERMGVSDYVAIYRTKFISPEVKAEIKNAIAVYRKETIHEDATAA